MPPIGPQDQFIIYSDVPPLGNEGISMSVLAHRIIASLEPNVSQIITRVASRKYPRKLIGTGLRAPTLLSWDCGGLWLRFLKGAARVQTDALLLRAWQRLAYRRAKSDRVVEVVGLSGPHWHFLPRLRDLARGLDLPYSVYVVDDYEVTAEYAGADQRALQATQRGIRECLQQAQRVFAICPGMAERLQTRYGVASRVLYPVADSVAPDNSAPVKPSQELVYVGSLGGSYLDVLEAVAAMLESGGAPGWRLKIISQDRRTFARVFGGKRRVLGRHDCNREQLRQEIAAAEAILIPYSFDPRWQTTAATSFPSKFMDAIVAGKPIVVLAPPYASITQHMQAAGSGFCVGTASECGQLLTTRPWLPNDAWRCQYADMLQRYHTGATVRSVVLS